MTRTTNARIAGFLFLFYIAIGVTSLVLFGRATSGEGTAAKLAGIAHHSTAVRMTIVISLLTFVVAVMLAVALYGLTRDEDHDLAVMALCCRVSEGVIGVISTVRTLGLLLLATAVTGATATDAAATNALGGLLLNMGGWTATIGATCFAVGSTLYSYLFLRAGSIPVPLAWLGVLGSALLVVGLPLRLAGFFSGPLTYYMWTPVAVFEAVLGFWLLVKGVREPATRSP